MSDLSLKSAIHTALKRVLTKIEMLRDTDNYSKFRESYDLVKCYYLYLEYPNYEDLLKNSNLDGPRVREDVALFYKVVSEMSQRAISDIVIESLSDLDILFTTRRLK